VLPQHQGDSNSKTWMLFARVRHTYNYFLTPAEKICTASFLVEDEGNWTVFPSKAILPVVMQCRSLEELAMDGRFPEACEIRSVVRASVRKSRWIDCVVTLSPSLSSLFRRYATSIQFLQNQKLHKNRYNSKTLVPKLSPLLAKCKRGRQKVLDFQMYRITDFSVLTGFLLLSILLLL